ncbi:MAG: type III PLP-dependent enzyme [Alphaproteobacteria bacterium]|nr:type III PLP-dependent enzyme [Alphaproteobacteria bacterium]
MSNLAEFASKRGELQRFKDVAEAIAALRPTMPVYALNPQAFRAAARTFRAGFPGETMYAVKANHARPVLDLVYAAGVRHFDVASIPEVKAIYERFVDAKMSFMAPLRLKGAAGEAFRHYGVRSFALDCEDELHAILAETGGANDRRIAEQLTLYVRVSVPADAALLELASKFGAGTELAARLLLEIAKSGARPALTFHVGSQCMKASAFADAIAICGEVIALAGVPIHGLDVGGGFPGYYQNVVVPPLSSYFEAIKSGLDALHLGANVAIHCEPGRALVADGLSLITQAMTRRGRTLYINDGIYGSLSEYALKNWPVRYPVRVFSALADGSLVQKNGAGELFKVFGPTCDTLDVLHYEIEIPGDVSAGDWIVFDKLGAYSCALRTAFNGFFPDTFVEVDAAL